MPHKTEKQLEKRIIQKYTSGLGAVVIARQLRIGSSTVYHVLDRAGILRDRETRSINRKGLRRFTDEQEKEISELYQGGKSFGEIGLMFNVTLKTISNVCRRRGVKSRKVGPYLRRMAATQLEEINRRWQAGESQAQIARMIGASQPVISRILRAAGCDKARRRVILEQHGMWGGGRFTNGQGYVFVLVAPTDPYASMRTTIGYVQEHRYVMAKHLGRALESYETIHHINGDKADNRIENLQLRHGKHGNNEVLVCRNCGSHDIAHEAI